MTNRKIRIPKKRTRVSKPKTIVVKPVTIADKIETKLGGGIINKQTRVTWATDFATVGTPIVGDYREICSFIKKYSITGPPPTDVIAATRQTDKIYLKSMRIHFTATNLNTWPSGIRIMVFRANNVNEAFNTALPYTNLFSQANYGDETATYSLDTTPVAYFNQQLTRRKSDLLYDKNIVWPSYGLSVGPVFKMRSIYVKLNEVIDYEINPSAINEAKTQIYVVYQPYWSRIGSPAVPTSNGAFTTNTSLQLDFSEL